MNSESKRIAVTGAGGYLGSTVCDYLERSGATVLRLSRKTSENGEKINWRHFALSDESHEAVFSGVNIDCLVHCAYDFSVTSWADIRRVNVQGSIRLIKAAREHGVKRIVVISTMSAFEGCRSHYGAAKLQIDKEALRLGAAVVRPGLIYGDKPGGMVGALTGLVNRLPVVPLIGSGRQILYLIHQEDLAALIKQLCDDSDPEIHVPIIAANSSGKSFAEILRLIARAHHRRRLFVPFPWRLAWLPLRMLEALRIGLRIHSDSVISLINQEIAPDFSQRLTTGISFRIFNPLPPV